MKAKWALLALMAVACFGATQGTGGAPSTRQTQRVQLRSGDIYVDPTGKVEVYAVGFDFNRASFNVRVEGITRTITLAVGAMGSEAIPPYAFRLLSLSPEPRATLEITRIQ